MGSKPSAGNYIEATAEAVGEYAARFNARIGAQALRKDLTGTV
jgi:hypothetical protein